MPKKIHAVCWISLTFVLPAFADTVVAKNAGSLPGSGQGVYENDDATGPNTLSCLPSAGAGNPCSSSRNGLGPLSPGIYYLAITRSANLPMSISGYIFSFGTFSTDVLGP